MNKPTSNNQNENDMNKTFNNIQKFKVMDISPLAVIDDN